MVSPQPIAMALPLKLSYIELQNAKDAESVDIEFNGVKYSMTQNQERRDLFTKAFDKPLLFETGALSLCMSRKKPLFSCCGQAVPETVTIRSDDILPKLNGQEFQHVWGKVSIKLGFLPQTQPVVTDQNADTPLPAKLEDPHPIIEQSIVTQFTSDHGAVLNVSTPAPTSALRPSNQESLRPTTKDLIAECPHFRVLVVGKSGVGKSTLINRIFGVETANVARDRPGEADIDQEYTSPQNDRLILHDSRGFEPADGGNYETVKSFIEKRKKESDIKDQLHAVWLCFQIPITAYGERLLDDAAEAFLRMREEVLGSTPTIIVFTKHDRLASFMRQKMPNDPEVGKLLLRMLQSVHEQGLEELIRITQDKVSQSFALDNQVSPVPLAAAGAQRMLPTLKIDLSIDVGKQRYWKALGTSANFPGHKMQDCLGVIHTDIVAVWNYYDPCLYLDSDQFRKLMINMVEKVDAPAGSTHQPSRSDSLDGSSGGIPLVALAPIILPMDALATLGRWVYETYQRLQGVPTKFMAYIVDLTHVLEILFALTAGMRAKKLTRRAIKLAYKAYHGSEWMRLTHTDIRSFQGWTTARDAVLDKITSMISSEGREVRVSRATEGIRREMVADLEEDEEWVVQAVSQ